jgi:hypothetical protein
MTSPTVSLTMREAGGFWALCSQGQRHRVTAYRVVKRSLQGGVYRAYTRFALPGGSEVMRVRGEMYRADRVGLLIRVTATCPRVAAGR